MLARVLSNRFVSVSAIVVQTMSLPPPATSCSSHRQTQHNSSGQRCSPIPLSYHPATASPRPASGAHRSAGVPSHERSSMSVLGTGFDTRPALKGTLAHAKAISCRSEYSDRYGDPKVCLQAARLPAGRAYISGTLLHVMSCSSERRLNPCPVAGVARGGGAALRNIAAGMLHQPASQPAHSVARLVHDAPAHRTPARLGVPAGGGERAGHGHRHHDARGGAGHQALGLSAVPAAAGHLGQVARRGGGQARRHTPQVLCSGVPLA